MQNVSMEECVKLCWDCRHECQEALFNHCLIEGGDHVAEDHVKLMTDCIQICQAAADFMTRGSALHAAVCEACAEICEACAESCEELPGEKMQRCAELCRQCADTCREMSGTGISQSGQRSGLSSNGGHQSV